MSDPTSDETTEPDVLDDLNEMWPELGRVGSLVYSRHECSAVMMLAAGEIERLRAALRTCVEAHETGRSEPAQIAYETAKRVLI